MKNIRLLRFPKKSRLLWLVIVITIFGLFIRLYKLTSSPEGLYIDETSIGYNAFSTLKTGRDEHGQLLPMFFEAFGEYKLPVYVYLVALFQFITGPTDASVRLPSVLFGSLTIPIVYLLIKEVLVNERQDNKTLTSVIGSFLLAVSPWHLQFSRPGFEATVGLFFMTLGLWTILRSVRLKSQIMLLASLASFVLSLYSYNSARIVVPLLLLAIFIFHFKAFSLKTWSKFFLIGFVALIPFLVFVFSDKGLIRARQVSIFFQNENSSRLEVLLENYWSNISLVYLFKEGDPTIGHLTQARMGLLHYIEAPFFILGIAKLIGNRSKKTFVMLILLVAGTLPPAISTLNPHALRGILVLPATVFISSIGFTYFFNFVKRDLFKNFLIYIYVITLTISTFNFLNLYHNQYIPNSGWDWQVGIKRASLKILAIEKKYNDIYFDVDPRAVPVAWYLKIDPNMYQNSMDKKHIGKYHINDNIFSAHGLYVGLTPPKGQLREYVYYPDNSFAYGIWEF